ncbi:MAG: hypothetical protein OEM96_01665 [Gemmatimonadota bacterium]|nr:hypothetical protein [Gemmatimonadota bacterium]
MSDLGNHTPSLVVRAAALALGLLLLPITLTPQGLDRNLACGSEGPDEGCMWSPGTLCKAEGEWVQHFRSVE